MSKNILLLVTGGTPQIITETIWALACDPQHNEQWVPDEVHIISTGYGLNEVKNKLLGKDKILTRMKNEYAQIANLRLEENFLHCFTDQDGNELEDLRTPEENEFAANLICEKIRHFSSDEKVSLHVSIAGGRKTMGFYAGYALSLYGRAQDRMSHVLVDEKFEKGINFYYPSKNENDFIIDRENKTIGLSKDAQVWLAQIPFVRLRTSLPEESLIKKANFSDVVNAINMASQPIKLILDVKQQKVIIGQKECELSSREFAFYYWFVKNKLNRADDIVAPEKGIVASSANKVIYPQMIKLAADYLSFYKPLKGFMGNDKVEETLQFGMERTFFDERKTSVLKAFKKTFGLDLANKIEIKNIARLRGTKGLSKEQKLALQGKYALELHDSNIEFIGNF